MPALPKKRAKSTRWLASAILAWAAALPAGGLELSEIAPLYFGGIGGHGFDPADAAAIGRGADFEVLPGATFGSAGDAGFVPTPDLGVTLLGLVEQRVPASPTLADPIVADATWRLRNETDGVLTAPLLIFTRVDPLGAYPIELPPTALDANLHSLLSYSFEEDDFLYAALQLPSLDPDDTVDVLVRYVVGGMLAPGEMMEDQLPPLGLALLEQYQAVPEPESALLVTAGLLAFAGFARRREAT